MASVRGTVCPGHPRLLPEASLQDADAAFRSTGYANGSNWVLSGNGHLGTFVQLDAPGTVQLTVHAAGAFADGDWPLMDLHVANQKASWSVADSGFTDYSATFQLPAGTHNVRVEFLNDGCGDAEADRDLILSSLSVSAPASGASLRNSDSAAVIADAADTYIDNYRKGPARIILKDVGGSPLPPRVPVHVKLRNHAFHFGLAVAGTDRNDGHLLDDNPTPGILLDNMRLVFGNDLTDGFLLWGFWQPRMWQPVTGAALYDSDWNPTESGKVYQQLLGIHDWQLEGVPIWITDLALRTDENGQIEFRGFYGDYDLSVGDTTWALSIVEGVSDYELVIVPEPSSLRLLVLGSIVLMFASCRRVKCPR